MYPKFNLLVIENEDLALQPVGVAASRLGHHVLHAEGNDLPVAMMNAWKDHIQAIVFDWTLSCVLYGAALIDALHTIDPEVPFVITTGYGENVIRPHLPETLKVSFLIKPFLSFDFENTLRCVFPKTLHPH